MSKHVAVLMGGWSAEREISLRSGKACAEALTRLGHRVTRIDVGRDIAAVLTTVKPDVALNMLHGRPGEDGTLQGVLEILAIPYSHSGVMASALAMQKDVAKDLFRAADVPVPEGLVASRFEVAKGHVLPPPYVIKPIAEGSSVGVFIVREDHAHPPQELTREDWPYGERLIVEKYIAGKELTCAVMGDAALGVIEIVPTVRFYDYEAKYVPGGSKHLLPAPVSSIVYQQVRRLALAAHHALGCRGVSRADFRYDDRVEGTGGLVCLEVNTQPGMTDGIKGARDGIAGATGFRVVSIALAGNHHVSREEVLAAAGVTATTSLLFLDVDQTRERLKTNPWIADATVLKLYPGELQIGVKEREAFALWQKDRQVSVIADDGTVLEPYVAPRLIQLPLVVGEGAQTKAKEFLALLDRYPTMRDFVRAAVLVGERRWNLRLKNGIDARLPETDVAPALERLVALDNEKNLITRDIVAIDLRLPDRVTVRLSEAAAQARIEALKDKLKKKGGNA